MPKITLVDKSINNTYVIEEVSIEENGDLLISGHDMGEAPKEIFGSSTYEHITKVKAKNKDWLLLKLLADKFENRVEIKNWLKKNDIPHELFAW